MGVERRQQPRFRTNLACEIRIAGESIAGKLRDVCAGGLAVVADGPSTDQGEAVVVTVRPPGLGTIVVRALVWHVHGVRRGSAKTALRSYGLVLSESAPEFTEWVGRLAQRASAPARSNESQAPASQRREYRIRIKQTSGPRTCGVVASGDTAEQASAAALAEVGPEWVVLEVTPLQPGRR